MKNNRDVVQIPEDVNAKGVDNAVGEKNRRVDTQGLPSRWLIAIDTRQS